MIRTSTNPTVRGPRVLNSDHLNLDIPRSTAVATWVH